MQNPTLCQSNANRRSSARSSETLYSRSIGLSAWEYWSKLTVSSIGAVVFSQNMAEMPDLRIFNRKMDCDRLRTDSAYDPCHSPGMKKKRDLTEAEKTTIARVNKEMQKPRLTESVRKGLRNRPEPSFEEPSARPEKA